jgi:hypothetical protein
LDLDRKSLIRRYKETPRAAGVFRVLNTIVNKSLVGSSRDLASMLNRQRFQLEHGSHPNRDLQKDWNQLGADAFAFEILDTLSRSEKDGQAPSDEDLRALQDLWLEKLSSTGVPAYNNKPENKLQNLR